MSKLKYIIGGVIRYAPHLTIIALFLLFLTPHAYAQYHLGYGELVSSSQGCDLYFKKPSQENGNNAVDTRPGF
jgi:hypothetical protein